MKRFLRWQCAITLGAVLIASPLVAQDDPNALMDDAISLYSTAMEVRGEERHQLLQQVDDMLSRIRTEFPDSAPASVMQLGIPLGPIDLNSLEAELAASEPKLAGRLSGELAEQWRILQKRSPDVAAVVEETLKELSGPAVEETKGELYVKASYYVMAAFYFVSDTAFHEFFNPTEAGELYKAFVTGGGLDKALTDIGRSSFEDIAVGVALDFGTSTIADFAIENGPEMGASTQTLVRVAIKATITEVLLAVQAYKDPTKIPGLGIKRVSELIEIITTTRGLAADVDQALAQTALRMQAMAQLTASYRDQDGVQNIISSTRKNLVTEIEGAVGKDDAKAVSDIMLLGWAALTAEFEGETERAQDLHKVILLRGNVDTMPTIWNAPDLLTYFANGFTDSPKRAAEIMVGLTELSKYSKALEPMEAVTTPSTSSELANTQIAPDGFLGAPIPNTSSEPEFVMGKWSIQEEPDFRLKAGEQSGGFEISKEGQISFSGTQLFGDYRTPGEWPSLAVFINKKQTRAMALAMGDGAERFSLVDLEERKVLNDKPLPFWMYGPTDDVIWDPSDRYVALSVPMAEYSKGLGVFDLETGQYSIIPSREFDASANDYWLLNSLYTEDDGRVSISVALQRFNSDGSPMRSDTTPPQKRTLDLTDFFVNLSDADSIKFVFPKEELDHVATLSNDGELRSTGFNADISDRLSVNCTHWVTQGAGAASEYGITTWQALLPKLQCNVWSDNDDGSSGLVPNIEVSAMLANDGAMIVKLADAEYFHNKRQGNLGQCAFSIQNQVFDYKKGWLAECPSESTISTTRIEPADLDVVQPLNCEPVSQAGFPQSWMNRKLAGQTATGSSWALHLWAPGSSFGVAEFTNAKGKTTDGFWRPTSTGICQSYNGRQSWICHDVLMCTSQNDRFVLRNEEGELTALVSTAASNDVSTLTNVVPITNRTSTSLIGRFGSEQYHETNCEIGPVVVSQSKVLFYESSCQLKRPIPNGANSHTSDVMCSGEGDTWPDRLTLSVTNQNTLSVMSNDRSTPSLYRRCETSTLSQGDGQSSAANGSQNNHLDSATLTSTRVQGVYNSEDGLSVELAEVTPETLVGLFRAFGALAEDTAPVFRDVSQFEAPRLLAEAEKEIEAARRVFSGNSVMVDFFEYPVNLGKYDFGTETFFVCSYYTPYIKHPSYHRGPVSTKYLKPHFPLGSQVPVRSPFGGACGRGANPRDDRRTNRNEPNYWKAYGAPSLKSANFMAPIPARVAESFDQASRQGLVRMSHSCEMFPAIEQTGTSVVRWQNSGTCNVRKIKISAYLGGSPSGEVISVEYDVIGENLSKPIISR